MFRWIAIMATVALAAGVAFAQSSSETQPALPLGSGQTMGHHMTSGDAMGPSMMDQSMMQMMRMMHMMDAGMMGPGMMDSGAAMMCGVQPGMTMAGAPGSYLEGRLAFVKAELAIDQTQEADWQKYAGAVRDGAQPMFSAMSGMHRAAADGSSFPSRFDARIEALEGQLSGWKAIRGAAVGLYDHLNPMQKQKADTLLPMSLCM